MRNITCTSVYLCAYTCLCCLTREISPCYRRFSDVQDQQEDYINASKSYEGAVAIALELGMSHSDDHVRLLCKIGSCAMKLRNDEKAREWLELAAQQLVEMDAHATPRYEGTFEQSCG